MEEGLGRAQERKENSEMRRGGGKDGDEAWTGGGKVSGKGGDVRDSESSLLCSRTVTTPAPVLCPLPAAPAPAARGLPQSRVEPARGDAAPRGLCPTGQLHPVPGRPREPAKVETHRPVSQLWE